METKVCKTCKIEKPLSAFVESKTNRDGYTPRCRKCINIRTREIYQPGKRKDYYDLYYSNPANKEKTAKRGKQWRETNKDRCKTKHLYKKYGITIEDKRKIYAEQNGCCAMCERPMTFESSNVDHNHKTNKIRALLCIPCNVGLRYIDDELFLASALKYKKKHD